MELHNFLRTPLFVEDPADTHGLIERIKQEEHTFVFLRRHDAIYAVSSIDLLLETAPAHDLSGPLPQEWKVTTLTPNELRTRAFDALSQEVTLVNNHGQLMYIRREDVLLALMTFGGDDDIAWLRILFASIPKGLMVVDRTYHVVNRNAEAVRMLRLDPDELDEARVDAMLGEQHFKLVETTLKPLPNQIVTAKPHGTTLLVDFAPLVVDRTMTGYALVLQDLPSVESMAMELRSVKRINEDLEAILSTIYDEIIVVDTRGVLLRASDHFIASQWPQPPNRLIGQRHSEAQAR